MQTSFFSNKRGIEKFFSIWWFLIIVIISLFVVFAVFIYYSSSVDTREVESKILYEKIINCLSRNGVLVEDIAHEGFDLFDACSLDKNLISNSGLFFLEVALDEKIIVSEGAASFRADCEIVNSGVIGRNYPGCTIESEKVFSSDRSESFELNTIVASNQEVMKVLDEGK